MSRDDTYLEDILHSARIIQDHLRGVSREEFFADVLRQDAVCRRFEIFGEAARHLSAEVLRQFPDIPWQLAIGMRNRIIHDYDNVKLDVLWEAAHRDLPPLVQKLDAYLSAHPPRISPEAPPDGG
jgi:uncharacterized protein with HEPN domain